MENNIENEENTAGKDNNKLSCREKRWCFPYSEKIATDFSAETSLHGLKYIGQKGNHWTERLFWIVGFLGSFALATFLIYSVWDKYKKSPVIITFKSDEQRTKEIPFPAVTICDMKQFSKSKVAKLEEIVNSGGGNDSDLAEFESAKEKLAFVRNICGYQWNFRKLSKLPFSEKYELNDDHDGFIKGFTELKDYLIESTKPCGELIKVCELGGDIQECSEIFKPVVTNFGKCCVFNMLPIPLLIKNINTSLTPFVEPKNGTVEYETYEGWKKWKYDKHLVAPYVEPVGFHKPPAGPWKQKTARQDFGLQIIVDSNSEDSYCPLDFEGFLYNIHSSLELPNPLGFGFVGDPGKEISLRINPDLITASDDIKDIKQEKRMCHFAEEEGLRFFHPYTSKNCIDQCHTLALTSVCNCTHFYLPRQEGVKICDYDSLCTKWVDGILFDKVDWYCGNCYKLCEKIEYNVETSMAALREGIEYQEKYANNTNWEAVIKGKDKLSILHVYMESETIIPKLRTRLYGKTDLIANTGGILGLCLGLSILSLLEIVYFGTVRALCKNYRRWSSRRVGIGSGGGWGKRKFMKIMNYLRGKRSKINDRGQTPTAGVNPGHPQVELEHENKDGSGRPGPNGGHLEGSLSRYI